MCQDYKNKVDKEPKMGYEYELLYMSRNISLMYVLNIPGLQWYEIDSPMQRRKVPDMGEFSFLFG